MEELSTERFPWYRENKILTLPQRFYFGESFRGVALSLLLKAGHPRVQMTEILVSHPIDRGV